MSWELSGKLRSDFESIGYLVALTGIERANSRCWLGPVGLSLVVSVPVVPRDARKSRYRFVWWSPGGHPTAEKGARRPSPDSSAKTLRGGDMPLRVARQTLQR
jgi:hypothetical protein